MKLSPTDFGTTSWHNGALCSVYIQAYGNAHRDNGPSIVAVFINKNINIHHLSKTLSFIMIRTTNAIDSRHEKAHGNWLILDKIESIPVLFRAPSFFLEWLSTDSMLAGEQKDHFSASCICKKCPHPGFPVPARYHSGTASAARARAAGIFKKQWVH